MHTALTLTASPLDAAALVLRGAVTPDAAVTALTTMEPREAKAILAALPPVVQTRLVRNATGGSLEAPLLHLLSPEEAVRAIFIDGSMWDRIKNRTWRTRVLGSRNVNIVYMHNAGELAERVADRDGRTFRVQEGGSKTEKVYLYLNAENAFVYLNAIFRADDRTWRKEMLRIIGPGLLAFVMGKYQACELEVETDEWEELLEHAPEDYRSSAARLARSEDAGTIEYRLLCRHMRRLHEVTAVPKDLVAAIGGSSEDVLGGLDLD